MLTFLFYIYLLNLLLCTCSNPFEISSYLSFWLYIISHIKFTFSVVRSLFYISYSIHFKIICHLRFIGLCASLIIYFQFDSLLFIFLSHTMFVIDLYQCLLVLIYTQRQTKKNNNTHTYLFRALILAYSSNFYWLWHLSTLATACANIKMHLHDIKLKHFLNSKHAFLLHF